jgi:predicted O-methyltransferase YrrM
MEFGIVNPEVEGYLRKVAPASEPVLAEMEELAARRDFPIVGPLVGRLLFVLARALGAERVFELGSGYGYSALWFAKALAGGGRVILTEGDAANVAAARGYFERAGLLDRAVFETGDGLEVIDRYPGPFDVVFCDIDKRDYPRAFHQALPRLRRGGLLITDNVLWSGRVARPAQDPDTAGVQEYNRLLMASPELVASLLPLRDGVAVAVKL